MLAFFTYTHKTTREAFFDKRYQYAYKYSREYFQ